jgi:hypothetical protein
VHHEPIPDPAPNGRPETEAVWWPASNGKGVASTTPSPPELSLNDLGHTGGEATVEEIWGTRGLARVSTLSRAEEPPPEDIWGPPLRVAGPNVPPAESIWGGLAEVGPPPPSPPPAHRRPFALPDAWASSGRPRRRSLAAFGRLNRRTG